MAVSLEHFLRRLELSIGLAATGGVCPPPAFELYRIQYYAYLPLLRFYFCDPLLYPLTLSFTFVSQVDIFRAVYCRNSDTRPTTATSSSPIDYVFNNTIVPPAARGLLKRILLSDQLGRVRLLGTAFKGFSVGPITFLPTLKYDSDSDEFDTSAKRRAPAWTDRILYKSVSSASLHRGNQTTAGAGESVLTLRRYGSLDVRHGDHRPVYGQFSLTLPPTTSRTTK